uniref:Uncharacterized protein n=1 Tax=Lotharella oceanica TaxID=641309 RepID=A0A7S2U2H5_9EUKA|mmetsp:Transcript_4309/g.8660  ORF Transcript_4309/g.8660 Transcript_4309/m.8660 type:complete len:150 (+) Transcript_4309:163-612(+)
MANVNDNSRRPVVWWITGRPSAGKTFTGDYLEASCGFTHVEGDWRMVSPAHKQITGGLVRSFYEFWFKDRTAPEELWQPYYGEVCAEAIEALERDSRKPVVVTLALYRKKVREYGINSRDEPPSASSCWTYLTMRQFDESCLSLRSTWR